MPEKKTESKKTEIHKRVDKLEKGHSKVVDLKDELRIIGMEYADIKYRIEATDVLIDHVIHQMDKELRIRRLNFLLALLILVMMAVIAIGVFAF
jgi:hypothetical protein